MPDLDFWARARRGMQQYLPQQSLDGHHRGQAELLHMPRYLGAQACREVQSHRRSDNAWQECVSILFQANGRQEDVSHDLDSDAPVVVFVQAQRKLGLVNHARNGTCRLLHDGGEKLKLVIHHKSGLLMVNVSQSRDLSVGEEEEIPERTKLQRRPPVCGLPSPAGETVALAGSSVSRGSGMSVIIASMGLANFHDNPDDGAGRNPLPEYIQAVLDGTCQTLASAAKGSLRYAR